jgi:hypothetical protein
MEKLSQKVAKITLSKESLKKYKNDDFEKALYDFKQMIANGITKPRGNRLCTPQDSCGIKTTYNQ